MEEIHPKKQKNEDPSLGDTAVLQRERTWAGTNVLSSGCALPLILFSYAQTRILLYLHDSTCSAPRIDVRPSFGTLSFCCSQMMGLFLDWFVQNVIFENPPKLRFFTRASERRVLLIVWAGQTFSHIQKSSHNILQSSHLLIIFSSSSYLLIFTSVHLHIFSSSHPHTFTPSHLHFCSSSHLLIFTPSQLHTFSSSHPHICTSSHLHICSSSHLHICSSSHSLLPSSSSHLHIFSSSHLHILTSSHSLLPPSSLSLLLSLSFLFLS